MTDIYLKNFIKYKDFVENFSGESYVDMVVDVQELLVPKTDNVEDRKAVVMHGFSGNGKTTWIRNFCKEHPDYLVLSMDSVVRKSQKETGKMPEGMEITEVFSKALDEICESGKNVIVDGNFLNLLTRMALVDSLHSYGYFVSLVDITPIFDVTIESRIMDEASRVFGARITKENVDRVRQHPLYKKVEEHVRGFHEREKASANYDEQKLVSGTAIGVEEVIVVGNDSKHGTIGGKNK